MRRALLVACLVTLSLGCGGLLLDPARLDAVLSEVRDSPPDEAIQRLAVGAADAGLVNPLCGECMEVLRLAEPDLRPVLAANALLEATCACPSSCASEKLTEVVSMERATATATLAATCDAAGPDPIFGGPMAPLRAAAHPVDYALSRMLVGSLSAPQTDMIREQLAIGMALYTVADLQPTPEPVVNGAEVAILTDRVEALRACQTHVQERIIVRPDGSIAHHATVGGGCVKDALSTLTFPAAEAWRIVDLTWDAQALAAPAGAPPADEPAGDEPADDEPDEPAPKEPEPDEPEPDEPAPAEKTTVKAGRAKVNGGDLSSDVVQKVLQRSANSFRACAKKNPAFTGAITLKFSIASDGSVASAAADGGDPAIGACLAAAARRLTFPSPNGVAMVSMPLNFSAP
jgi:hypothetical protein